jgi:hypothetical protein
VVVPRVAASTPWGWCTTNPTLGVSSCAGQQHVALQAPCMWAGTPGELTFKAAAAACQVDRAHATQCSRGHLGHPVSTNGVCRHVRHS